MHGLLIALLLLLPWTAEAELRVFACEPEWQALAEEVGGELVRAGSATHEMQDPHYVEARPSLISQVRKADLVVCSGAQLEIGWLPMLLTKANNPRVLPGRDGFVEASSLVRRLDVPDSVDSAQGDMHPQGNPHIQMNPHNIVLVGRELGRRMARLDPENSAAYQARTADFLERWEAAIEGWEARAAPLSGKRVVSHHQSWVYLTDWLGLREVATLEPVPGIPPTAAHLAQLIETMRARGVKLVLTAAWSNNRQVESLAERTGSRVLELPTLVGGAQGADTWIAMQDLIHARLVEALAPEGAGGE
jgi:zinc/manganese transport system substrate-binding protein